MGHQQTIGRKVKTEWERGRVGERDRGKGKTNRQSLNTETSYGQLLQIGDEGPLAQSEVVPGW